MCKQNHLLMGAYFYPLTTKCLVRKQRAKRLNHNIVDETLLVQQAKPLFPGHHQPNTYCLGSENFTRWDDADLRIMEKQIKLAHKYGLDFFIFDTYIGTKKGKIYKEMLGPLDNAFLKTKFSQKMLFAIMCVFGSPRVILPVPKNPDFIEKDRYYDLNDLTAQTIIDHCVKNYWNKQNYLHIKGRPYLSFFTSDTIAMTESEKHHQLKKVLSYMKKYSWQKYHIHPYIVGVVKQVSMGVTLAKAGADALTSYAFLTDFGTNTPPIQNYNKLVKNRIKDWFKIKESTSLPFVPPAVVGWDASPRGFNNYNLQDVIGCYPYTPIVISGNSLIFQKMLKETLNFTLKEVPKEEQYGLICAWNEISEGCALLPKLQNKHINYSYLRKTKKTKEWLMSIEQENE